MGGGSLMTPILILLFGFKPTVAVGTDIVHGAIFKTFGAARHRQARHRERAARRLDAGRQRAALARSASRSRPGSSTTTEHGRRRSRAKILGVALVLGGIGFFVKTFVRGKENSYAPFPVETRDKLIAIGIGAFGGFIVGLTSVGSGTFFGLAMLILFPLSAARVVGTDIFQAAALLWVAGVGHMIAGNVDFHATGWLLIGSIPGVLIGSNVSVRLPERALRVALATTLTLSGIRLLEVPFAQYYIPVTLAFVGRRRRSGRGAKNRQSRCRGHRRQRAGDEGPAGEPAAELVRLAARAEPGHGGEQRQRGDDRAEHDAGERQPDRVGERRRGQEDRADDVREAGRARVLERPLAEARLHELEVGDARQAVAASEDEADDQLRAEEREQEPPAGEHGDERQDPDRRLVEARRPRVDHVGVAVRVGAALHKVKSYQSPHTIAGLWPGTSRRSSSSPSSSGRRPRSPSPSG